MRARDAILEQLFGVEGDAIGTSYLRLSRDLRIWMSSLFPTTVPGDVDMRDLTWVRPQVPNSCSQEYIEYQSRHPVDGIPVVCPGMDENE